MGENYTQSADRHRRAPWTVLALHLVAPALLLAAALVLPSQMIEGTREARGDGPGPAAWPNVMLVLIVVCAAIWLVQEIMAWRRGREGLHAEDVSPEPEREYYHYPKAVGGLLMILAYGWLLPVIGFPIATVIFIVTWCLLGGIRSPITLVLVSLIGTGALLWLFMGLALMPLSRGRGVFDQISIALLQALGIY